MHLRPAISDHNNRRYSDSVLLEEFESFKYLGSFFTVTDQVKDEMSGGIGPPSFA